MRRSILGSAAQRKVARNVVASRNAHVESNWNHLESLRARAETLSAVLKSVLILAFTIIVAALIISLSTQRSVSITVTSNAAKLQDRLGITTDIPGVIVSNINKIALSAADWSARGVNIAVMPDSEIRLSSFGLDMSSSEVVNLIRDLLPFNVSPRVVVDIACPNGACDGNFSAPVGTELVIVANIRSGRRSAQIALPFRIHAGTLSRDIDQALFQMSERVLEHLEPELATMHYISRSVSSDLQETAVDYSLAAVRSALNKSGTKSASACLAHLSRGIVLDNQGLVHAAAAELASAMTADIHKRTCFVLANVRIAITKSRQALCSWSEQDRKSFWREANAALQSLMQLPNGGTKARLVEYARSDVMISETIAKAIGEDRVKTLLRECTKKRFDPKSFENESTTPIKLRLLLAIIPKLDEKFPLRNADSIPLAHALESRVASWLIGVPFSEFDEGERYALLSKLAERARRRAEHDSNPGTSYFLAGRLSLEIASLLELGALNEEVGLHLTVASGLKKSEKSDSLWLNKLSRTMAERAIADFQAAVASPFYAPDDANSMIAVGDAIMALEGDRAATIFYAKVVNDYFDNGRPIENFPPFIGAAARWASLITKGYPCESRYNSDGMPSLREARWDKTWAKSNVLPNHNPCQLRPGRLSLENADKLGVLNQIWPYMGRIIQCHSLTSGPISSASCMRNIAPEDEVSASMRDGVLTKEVIENFFSSNVSSP